MNPIKKLTPVWLMSAFILITSQLNAQTSWTPVYTDSQIQINQSAPTICNFSDNTVQAEYIFLQIKNLQNRAIKVNFRVDVYYVGMGCGTCNNEEYQYQFNIPANGSLQADCNFTSTGQSKLAVFKKYISKVNRREFEKFEISAISVE